MVAHRSSRPKDVVQFYGPAQSVRYLVNGYSLTLTLHTLTSFTDTLG